MRIRRFQILRNHPFFWNWICTWLCNNQDQQQSHQTWCHQLQKNDFKFDFKLFLSTEVKGKLVLTDFAMSWAQYSSKPWCPYNAVQLVPSDFTLHWVAIHRSNYIPSMLSYSTWTDRNACGASTGFRWYRIFLVVAWSKTANDRDTLEPLLIIINVAILIITLQSLI